jgi:hypothetical protein
MRISIVADVVEPQYEGYAVNAEYVKGFIEGCHEFIVPGVVGWDDVQTEDLPGDTIGITAELRAIGVILGGEWSGRRITAEWVADYIMGAGEYWLIPGSLSVRECRILVSRQRSVTIT